ncbi:MAG: 16S rRNA processing protein RimM [Acidobacteria bacterium]|nr:16S rRNA processing protein RimM [Acidobacteriota bacterium]
MARRPPAVAGAPARLTVARIVKPQGRHGEVAAQILTDFPERLLARREVWLWDGGGEARRAAVERVWPHKNYVVFQFAGCATRSEAEALVGLEVQIPREEAAPLGEATFYEYELVGAEVVEQASGARLGRVRELVATGATPLLAVDTPEGKELLIPLAEEFCRRIAPEEKRIEVALPDELKELNR